LNYKKDKLILFAKDNGVGFLINEKKEGIGLSNIKNRIKLIGAEVNFVTAENKGTSIEITYKYE
jgi:signal transduction histidine kinase